MIISQKINVIRYTNGTLVKITPSAEEFLSPDYDPENPTAATYLPEEIYLEAVPQGDLRIAGWQYSVNGQDWEDVSPYVRGISVSGNTMTILSSCDLFPDGYLLIKAYANDPTYYDTVTLRKEVDPTIAFVKASTAIDQTNRKIALIASEEQLAQFTEHQTMVNKMADIEVKADSITSKVTREYATMTYANEAASSAESAANSATDNKLGNYYTKTQTTSEINQKANQITSTVSQTYQTKTQAGADLAAAKKYAEDEADAAESAANAATDDKLKGYTTTSQYSTLSQTVDGVSTEVGKKVGNTEIISRINQSPEEITIDAGKVNIGGALIVDKINNEGTSVAINADKIDMSGAVIVERINGTTASVSIDADKINLNGAVTANNYFKINTNGSFEAVSGLIGAIHVIANAIYSGSHSSAASSNDGFYIGADGAFGVGNGTEYIRWTKNSNNVFKLEIKLSSLSIGGLPAATENYADGKASAAESNAKSYASSQASAAESSAKSFATGEASGALTSAKNYTNTKYNAAMDAAEDAAKTATNYLYYDGSNGLVISQIGNVSGDAGRPFNTRIYGQGIQFRSQAIVLSEITGTTYKIYCGTSGQPGMTLDTSGLILYSGSTGKMAVNLSTEKLTFYRGKTEKQAIVIGDSNLSFYDRDGSTLAATIGASGLEVRRGIIGGFEITSTAKSASTSAGGHLYKDSFFIHTSDNSYEYEFGIHGETSKSASGLYVARIDKGGTWSTSNATLLTHLTNDGTLKTIKAEIGGWDISSTAITSNKLVLDSVNNQISMKKYSRDSYNTSRTTAFIREDGRTSFKGVCVDEFTVGDDYPWVLSSHSGWNVLSACRGELYFHNLRSMTGVNNVVTSTTDRVYKAAASSIRYKDVDRYMTDEDVQDAFELQPVIAKYKEGYLAEEDRMNGEYMPMFIAEDVAKTIPEAVIYNGEDQVEDWNYRVIIPVQHQMILAQQKRIDKLENELADIKKLLKEVLENANK